ncbi:MAG: ABC transporter permease [Nanoarchaeota archaeon]|nr:ABC transporter permease [Nanoarchaeota archaeon]
MINTESIRYSLRNLKHRKGRSFLTVFSILIGIATIFIFISFGLGLYNYTQEFASDSSADKILILAKGGSAPGLDTTFKLTERDLEVIERSGGVYEATGLYYSVVQVERRSEKIYTFIVSYDPSTDLVLDFLNADIEKGRLLESGDTKKAVLGYNYMFDDRIFKKGLDINDQIEINGTSIKVVGFFESFGNPTDDSQIYITNNYYKDLFPEKDSYSQIIARADIKNIDLAISNIERDLRNERDQKKGEEDFYVQSFQDLIETYSAVLNIIVGFVILIALISVLVSGINTANTMITSVLERFKEIGVLKSIGARNREIFGIFLFESAFLGVLAGIMGVLLGFLITSVAGSVLANLGWSFLAPYYSPWLFIGCILFAGVTGAISGVIPAIRASKINTVDALRYE